MKKITHNGLLSKKQKWPYPLSRRHFHSLLVVVFLFFCVYSYGQSKKRIRYSSAYRSDTSSINQLLRDATDSLIKGYYENSLQMTLSAISLSKKNGYKTGVCKGLNLQAKIIHRRANYDSSATLSKMALILAQDLNDSSLLSDSYLNLGNSSYSLGNLSEALEFYLKGLAIQEKIAWQGNLIGFLNNIAGIFADQQNDLKALEYYRKSMIVAEKTKDYKRQGTVYHNLGSIYMSLNMYDSAKYAFEKSLAVATEQKDAYVLNLYLGDMAEFHFIQKHYQEAYDFAVRAVKGSEQFFKDQLPDDLMMVAIILIKQGKNDEAEIYLNRALRVAKEIESMPILKDAYENLAILYEKKGDYRSTYGYYELFSNIKDTLLNEKNSRRITEMSSKYATQKKQDEISLLRKNEDIQRLELQKKNNELTRQQTFSISIFIGFLLLLAVAALLFSRYRLKKKANESLEKAYHIIEEKNKIIERSNHLITDSITYAKHIQDAILPSGDDLDRLFPGNHFVFYQPAHIVSGDFYWCSRQNGKVIIAIADCTGHGVSGAFMSLIGNTLLNEIVNERKITNTKEIAKLLDAKVIQTLNQYEGSGKYDGMDISICCIDIADKSITFTGAHHVMYAYNGNLHKIKCDPYSIGGAQQQNAKLFTSQVFDYEEGLCLYFLTDGYCDQSGGPLNKRFSFSRFEKLLMQMQDMDMAGQKEKIQQTFEEWKGDIKQRDDVLVIGIKC